jgi:hypothetical protein
MTTTSNCFTSFASCEGLCTSAKSCDNMEQEKEVEDSMIVVVYKLGWHEHREKGSDFGIGMWPQHKFIL